jgi:hypothetical protein
VKVAAAARLRDLVVSRRSARIHAVPETLRIVVSAYCQTGGLAAALQRIFPAAELHAVPVLDSVRDQRGLAKLIRSADAWVNCQGEDGGRWAELAAANPRLRYVDVPLIEFRAFHPDMCSAYDSRTGQNCRQKYSSRIGVWAYHAGIEPAAAVRLFDEDSFARLGYLDCWSESVDILQERFRRCGLAGDFERFYLKVKRSGQFMHTSTHPRTVALIALAKIAAQRLGAADAALDREIVIPDGLDYLRWPVYPEIASTLGVASTGYVWKMKQATLPDDLFLDGIEAFLEYCFRHYREQGIRPADIAIREAELGVIADALKGQAAP